ncbi:MAG: hypothetical protein AAF989_11435, partial [Planctomycetota bacterium]
TPVQSRGLCPTHHSRFHRQRREMSPESRVAFEEKLVELGMLLPARKPGRKVEQDAFRDVADALLVAEKEKGFASKKPAKAKRAKKSPRRKRGA